eukprot:1835289-Rhodomonas_salina.2
MPYAWRLDSAPVVWFLATDTPHIRQKVLRQLERSEGKVCPSSPPSAFLANVPCMYVVFPELLSGLKCGAAGREGPEPRARARYASRHFLHQPRLFSEPQIRNSWTNFLNPRRSSSNTKRDRPKRTAFNATSLNAPHPNAFPQRMLICLMVVSHGLLHCDRCCSTLFLSSQREATHRIQEASRESTLCNTPGRISSRFALLNPLVLHRYRQTRVPDCFHPNPLV